MQSNLDPTEEGQTEEISVEVLHNTEGEEEETSNLTEEAMITHKEGGTPTHTEEDINKRHNPKIKTTSKLNPKGETIMDIEEDQTKIRQTTMDSKENGVQIAENQLTTQLNVGVTKRKLEPRV